MPKWLMTLLLVFALILVSWLVWMFFYFTDKSVQPNYNSATKPSFLAEDGVEGYIVRQENSIYFIPEKDAPSAVIENESWHDLSTFSGHPTGYILFGKPIERNYDILTTGVKVRIWYTHILETFPAQIDVLKIIVYYD